MRGSWLGEAQTDEVKANKFFQLKSFGKQFTSSGCLGIDLIPSRGRLFPIAD